MIFKIKDLGSEEDLNITAGEIISTELNRCSGLFFLEQMHRLIGSTWNIYVRHFKLFNLRC